MADVAPAEEEKRRPPIVFLTVTVVIVGFSQLLAWLGAGGEDGFIGTLTTMQTVAIISMLINLVAFIPAFIYQTEHYYDLTGSITYLTCTWYSFFAGSFNGSTIVVRPRAIIISCMVTVWAVRLGYFLFKRVKRQGKDGRFDDIKPYFATYLMTWAIQGLWVYLTAYCAFIINSDVYSDEFFVTDYIGFAVWALGFLLEIVADNQKTAWRARPENKGKFIDYGLWHYSRHPNYLGEVSLWVGIFIVSTGILNETQWVAVIAPIFEFCLIYFVSGVPMLERRSDEKFGDLEEYKEYKRTTSVFLILPKGVTLGCYTDI